MAEKPFILFIRLIISWVPVVNRMHALFSKWRVTCKHNGNPIETENNSDSNSFIKTKDGPVLQDQFLDLNCYLKQCQSALYPWS